MISVEFSPQLVWNPSEDLLLTVSEKKEYHQDVIMLNRVGAEEEREKQSETEPRAVFLFRQ